MAAALPYIAAAGTAFSVIQSIQQGNAAKAAGDYNASIARRNATIAVQQASADAQAKDREKIQRLGAFRAAYGASGVTGEGNAIDIMATNAALFELDKQSIMYRGRLRALGYEDTATLEEIGGKSAQTAGYIGAGAALMSGVNDIREAQQAADIAADRKKRFSGTTGDASTWHPLDWQ
jgi:hypothetical protein